MQEMENELQEEENSSSRVYELGYLLAPTIKEEDIAVNYGNLKELIASLRGEIITDAMPKLIPLSYPMRRTASNPRHKFNTAYFGWIKFVMNSLKLLELKGRLQLDSNFIRFLVLKTVRENTIAAKRFTRGDMPYRRGPIVKRGVENETVVPINKEEIDKEIDALVAG